MTVEECNKAAAERIPVTAHGIRYGRISAVIKKFPTELQISRGTPSYIYLAELEDIHGHSVTVVRAEDVEIHTENT